MARLVKQIMSEWTKLQASKHGDNKATRAHLETALSSWLGTLKPFCPTSASDEEKKSLAAVVAKFLNTAVADVRFKVSGNGVEFDAKSYLVEITRDKTKSKSSELFSIQYALKTGSAQSSAGLKESAHAEDKWYYNVYEELGKLKVSNTPDKLSFPCVIAYASTAPCTDKCSWSFAALATKLGGPIINYAEQDWGHLLAGGKPGPIVLFLPQANNPLAIGTVEAHGKFKLFGTDPNKDPDKLFKDTWANFKSQRKLQEPSRKKTASKLEADYTLTSILGDGNCLFRAISMGIHGNQDQHLTLRNRAVAHMQEHTSIFQNLDENGATDTTYLNRMNAAADNANDSNRWGGFPELYALSRALRRRIVVHAPDFANGQLSIEEENDNRFYAQLAEIHLSYSGGNHYELLTPK